jgi:hypothetical protein
MEGNMDWPWIIFTIVGVGVWILVSVFRKAEEERQRNLPRPAARGPNRGSGQRPMSDLDRFLEEARRRRDQGQRPAQTIEIPQALPVNRAPRPPRETRRPTAARPPQRRAEFVPSVRRSVSERRPENIPTATAAPTPPKPIPAAVVLEVVSEDEQARLSGLPSVIQALPAPVSPLGGVLAHRVRPISPVVANLPALLRNPQTTAAAFVLREIFGPPVCRRFMYPTNAVEPRS